MKYEGIGAIRPQLDPWRMNDPSQSPPGLDSRALFEALNALMGEAYEDIEDAIIDDLATLDDDLGPWAAQLRDSIQRFVQRNAVPSTAPPSNPALSAELRNRRADTRSRSDRARSRTGATTNVNTPAPPAAKGDADRLFKAITGQESGGKNVVNRDSGAIGIGQVMPANVRKWSKEALGRSITPAEFKRRPDLQRKIVRFKLDQYLKEGMRVTGNRNEAVRYAAAKWYSGSGKLRNSTKPQYSNGRRYPSISHYANQVLARFKRA